MNPDARMLGGTANVRRDAEYRVRASASRFQQTDSAVLCIHRVQATAMADSDRSELGGLWDGLSYVVVGLVATGVLVFSGDSADVGGVVAGLALVGIGVAAVLAPRVSPLFADSNPYWRGAFWALCGLGILGVGRLSSTRWVSGVVLGGGLVVYGVLTASNR